MITTKHGSEFAKLLSEKLEQTLTRRSEIETIDAALAEVRAVLSGLYQAIDANLPKYQDEEIMQRARTLYSELKVED